MFSEEICTQQAANILIAVKYIWYNMLGDAGAGSAKHEHTRGLAHTHTHPEWPRACAPRREEHGPSLESPHAPRPPSSSQPSPSLRSSAGRTDAIYNTDGTAVTRLCNLKQRQSLCVVTGGAPWELSVPDLFCHRHHQARLLLPGDRSSPQPGLPHLHMPRAPGFVPTCWAGNGFPRISAKHQRTERNTRASSRTSCVVETA